VRKLTAPYKYPRIIEFLPELPKTISGKIRRVEIREKDKGDTGGRHAVKAGHEGPFWGGIVKSMGLVFGDIGTSPIYTLTVIFALTTPTRENVFGILSLVFWTLTLLVTVEYSWLAMSLGRKGQGGEIVLREILIKLPQIRTAARVWRVPLLCRSLPPAG